MSHGRSNVMNRVFIAVAAVVALCHLQVANAVTLVSMAYWSGSRVCDDAGNPYPVPEWTPAANYPRLCVRNTPLILWPISVTNTFSAETYYIQFQGIDSYGMVLRDGSDEEIGIQLAQVPCFSFMATSGTNRLPDYTDARIPYVITWKCRTSPDVLPRQWTGWSTFGTTSNPLYVCLAAPSTSPLYRTVVHNACKNGGAATEQQAFDRTWLAFNGCVTKTWNGQTLYYYQPGTTFAQNFSTLADLLTNRRGQCGAWREFMLACLGVHNIGAIPVRVEPSHNPPNQDDDGMVVKKWSEDNAGSPPPPYLWKISFPSGTKGEMVPGGPDYGDLTSEPSIAGQGTAGSCPSEKIFGVHLILKYGSQYYDPSYSKYYTSSNHMESVAIYGFCDDNRPGSEIQVRRAGTSGLFFNAWH